MSRTRTAERTQFLADMLTTAIEHYGYGVWVVEEYHADVYNTPGDTYAMVTDEENEELPPTRVDIDLIAKGIGVMKKNGNGSKNFWKSNATNGEDGDYDVTDALAVLDSAIYGEITYC